MKINVAYDSSAASAPAGLKAVVDYVVGLFDATFTNNVTLNLTIGWGTIGDQILPSNHLGESDPSLPAPYN